MLTLLWFLFWFFLGLMARERQPIDTFAVSVGSWGPLLRPIAVLLIFASPLMAIEPPANLTLICIPGGLVAGWLTDTILQDMSWSSPAYEFEQHREQTLNRRRMLPGSDWNIVLT